MVGMIFNEFLLDMWIDVLLVLCMYYGGDFVIELLLNLVFICDLLIWIGLWVVILLLVLWVWVCEVLLIDFIYVYYLWFIGVWCVYELCIVLVEGGDVLLFVLGVVVVGVGEWIILVGVEVLVCSFFDDDFVYIVFVVLIVQQCV